MITEERIKKIIRTSLDELYSEKLVQQLIDKFKEETPDLDDSIIRGYIDRFQQIKDSPNVVEKDITKYSWDDLETTIINNQPKDSTKNVNKQEDTIYNDNGLEILIGNSKDSCIMYGGGYRFCISARGERNAFDNYRTDNTIYFVIDHERSNEKDEEGNYIDPYHVIVVMKDQLFDDFSFTNANNKIISPISMGIDVENKREATWDDILSVQPKLRGKEGLFKFVEPEMKSLLKQKYEKELFELNDVYKSIFPFRTADFSNKLIQFNDLTKNSWELANTIFNKGKRYIVYDKDNVPRFGEIKIDDEPKDKWFERSKNKIPQMTKGEHVYGTHAEISDFENYPEEYEQYIDNVKNIMRKYYRKISQLK